MKNFKIYASTLFFLSLFFSWGSINGQGVLEKENYSNIINGGQIIDVEEGAKLTDPNNSEVQLALVADSECSSRFSVYVFFTNVDDEGNWPPNYNMALEVSVGNVTLDLINLDQGFYSIHENNGIPMSMFRATVEFDVQPYCAIEPGSSNSPNGILSARLVGSLAPHEQYNVNAHTDSGELFECDAYSDCSSEVFATQVITRTFRIDCSKCQSPSEFQGSPNDEFARQGAVETLLGSPSLAPNPVQDFTTLTYQLAQDSEVMYTVFDATGRVVDQAISQEGMGKHQKTIDTYNWAPGIYLLQLKTGDQSTGIRMIKH